MAIPITIFAIAWSAISCGTLPGNLTAAASITCWATGRYPASFTCGPEFRKALRTTTSRAISAGAPYSTPSWLPPLQAFRIPAEPPPSTELRPACPRRISCPRVRNRVSAISAATRCLAQAISTSTRPWIRTSPLPSEFGLPSAPALITCSTTRILQTRWRTAPRALWVPSTARYRLPPALTALGGGYYSIHPALPWFFRELFDLFRKAPRRVPGLRSSPDRVHAISRPPGALRQRLFENHAAAWPPAFGRRRRLTRLVLGMVPRRRMGGFRSHEQLRTLGRPYHRGLGTRLQRRQSHLRRSPGRRQAQAARGGGCDAGGVSGAGSQPATQPAAGIPGRLLHSRGFLPASFEKALSTHSEGSSFTARRMRSCHQSEICSRSLRS